MAGEAGAVPVTSASPSLSTSVGDLDTSSAKEALQQQEAKAARIVDACNARNVDLLASLASEDGGYLRDDLRQRAWPILLGSDPSTLTQSEKEHPWTALPAHRDEEQVRLDVNRSFVYYPSNETDKQLDARRVDLEALIVGTLRRHPSLCYFQGYHDIVQVFLLVQGLDATSPLVRRLSLLRIRDFMLPKLSASVSHLQLLPAILYNADRDIYNILPANPFYGLAHVLTLYSHDIHSYKDIARLFDFLLAREAVMSIYLFAVIVISKREQLLEYMADGPDEDVMSVVLQKLPEDINIDDMITQATRLFEQYPPSSLPFRTWRRVSDYSVLKTTLDVKDLTTQTLEQGQNWFDKHAEEIRKQEAKARMIHMARKTLYKYQRPVVLTLSVAVCVVALWLGKDRESFGGVLLRFWSLGSRQIVGIKNMFT